MHGIDGDSGTPQSRKRRPRSPSHDCTTEIKRGLPGYRLRVCCVALAKGIGRSMVPNLVAEGLPHEVVSVGPGKRVSRRFDLAAVNAWFSGRRARQIARNLEGSRYARELGL